MVEPFTMFDPKCSIGHGDGIQHFIVFTIDGCVTKATSRIEVDHERAMLRRLVEVVGVALSRRQDVRPLNAELAAFTVVHATFSVIQGALAERPELLADDGLRDALTELCVRFLRSEEVG